MKIFENIQQKSGLSYFRNFFKHIALKFDRSFSRGFFKQVLWLFGFTVIVFAFLFGLSYIPGCDRVEESATKPDSLLVTTTKLAANDSVVVQISAVAQDKAPVSGNNVSTDGVQESKNDDVKKDWQTRVFDILMLLMDPGNMGKWMHNRFIAICAFLGLVIFCGMLISLISNVLERRVNRYLHGGTNYRADKHVVILGYDDSVPSLLKTIRDKHGKCFVVLMCNKDIVAVRARLHARVDSSIEDRLILLRGSRSTVDDLMRLSLKRRVREIFVLGEQGEVAHDTISMECVKRLAELMPAGETPVNCFVRIDSHAMFSVLQSVDFGDTELENENKNKSKSENKDVTKDEDKNQNKEENENESENKKIVRIKDRLNFRPFNFNEIWSQKALATIPEKKDDGKESMMVYFPLDGDGITKDDKHHVHLFIMGMNDMATSLAVNAAHIMHFPNYKDGDFSTVSTITFIVPDELNAGGHLRKQYRHLFDLVRWRQIKAKHCLNKNYGWNDPMDPNDNQFSHLGDKNFMDIQWEFIIGGLLDEEINTYLENCCKDESEIVTIALCDEDAEFNTKLCLALSDKVHAMANMILVRQMENPVSSNLVSRLPNHSRVRPFGMMSECYRENLTADKYGKIINACYHGIDVNNPANAAAIDKAWADCPVMHKWSSVYSANMLFVKLRSLGLVNKTDITADNINSKMSEKGVKEAMQRTEHNRWVTERLLLGLSPLTQNEIVDWKNHGREPLLKQNKHLCICSNDKLDKEYTQKDDRVNSHLFEIYDQLIKKQEQNDEDI